MKTSNRVKRKFAILLCLIMIIETVMPPAAMALTSGPAQPEFQGFQQASTSDMVDLFTGDFSYNIPLMDVGGYPINLSYQSNPGMDEEASWVGLGWSLNPGAINRSMRGLPDDFDGDEVKKENNMAEDRTIGVRLGVGAGAEIAGLNIGLNLAKGLNYNSRRGFEITRRYNATVSISGSLSPEIGVGLDFSPSKGASVSTSVGIKNTLKNNRLKILKGKVNWGLNASLNSRTGMDVNLGVGASLGLSRGGYKLLKGNYQFSFNELPYIPTTSLQTVNKSLSLYFKGGGEVFGVHPHGKVEGFSSVQKMMETEKMQASYGYLYLNGGNENNIGKNMDYNADWSMQYVLGKPYLPLAFGTYDLFTYSGQGIGGSFRAKRNDVGMFYPGYSNTISSGKSGGGEIGWGAYKHVGLSIQSVVSENLTSVWASQNKLATNLKFTEDNENYESVFFHPGNSMMTNQDEIATSFGKSKPIRAEIKKVGREISSTYRFNNQSSRSTARTDYQTTGNIQNDEKNKRNESISYLNAEEATAVGLDHEIKNYPLNTLSFTDCDNVTSISRLVGARKGHHLSEMKVTNPNGSRYVYGLPVYNLKNKQVSFSVDDSNIIPSETNIQGHKNYGLINYTPGIDNSILNNKGVNKYFDATTIPAYAHSFLLTGVLSPDYVDRTNNGITEDDLGNAYKFNYTLHDPSFKWRTPVSENKAKYLEGLKASSNDDMGSYLYGEKEIWYMHSIESRTMVAQFYLSAREDALGVLSTMGSGENGGKDINEKLLKLDSIALFTKAELQKANPIPIKTAHLRYHYDLCKGVPNQLDQTKGKLTLEKVFFTYGNNKRGTLNAYKFSYNTGIDYNSGHYDRWGAFKINPAGYPQNHDYPYVLQKEDSTVPLDQSGAWSMKAIELPSGGKIEVTYESDDYAYVQNSRAGQMMEIEGFSLTSSNSGMSSQLYTVDALAEIPVPHLFMGVKLPYPVATMDEAKKRYLDGNLGIGLNMLYFDCLVKLRADSPKKERIQGYLSLVDRDPFLFNPNSEGKFTHMKLLVRPITDNKDRPIHPIVFQAIQKMRLDLPELFYDGFSESTITKAMLKSMRSFGKELKRMFRGVEYASMADGHTQFIDVDNKASWIRLCNPDFKKLGGGSRVKEIVMSDEWSFSGGTAEYGQSYDYTTTKVVDGIEHTISSGVASFEPSIGGEENLMKKGQPYFPAKNKFSPKELRFDNMLKGEPLYPAPIVGYSKVKVTNIANDIARNSLWNGKNKSGYSVYEFYTNKDFPTFFENTPIDYKERKPNPIFKFLRIDLKQVYAVSQGYTVEVNDMHGKQKRNSIYDKNNDIISSTEYQYKTEDKNAEQKRLDSQISVMDNSGSVNIARMGITTDVWQEMRQIHNLTGNLGIDGNVDIIPLFGIPIPIMSIFGKAHEIDRIFRAAVTTKLVQRKGILDKVVVTENGSSISTENVLYDDATGQVLLTKTSNEFNDPIYNFTYPAHLVYPGMGQAYQNLGAVFNGQTVTNGVISTLNPDDFFMPGDELMITVAGTPLTERYFIANPDNIGLRVIDKDGAPFSGTDVGLKIVRSGFRNQPMATVAQVSTRNNPVVADQLQIETSSEVLNASAGTFAEEWKMQCNTITDGTGTEIFSNEEFNPYVTGLLGNWRPHETYVYYDRRTPGTLPVASAQGMHIKETGAYNSFSPFWNPSTNNPWSKTDPSMNPWTRSNTATLYDWKGNELENLDAQGTRSSAYFGFNKSIPTAVVANSKYSEMVYDGFEDYGFSNDCNGDFDLSRSLDLCPTNPSGASCNLSDKAHTGKSSLMYEPGQSSDHIINFNDNCAAYVEPTGTPGTTGPVSASECGDTYLTDGGATPPMFHENTCCACLPILTPFEGSPYQVSVWVASEKSLNNGSTPVGPSVEFLFPGLNVLPDPPIPPVALVPSGPVVDGWQRWETKISIPYTVFDVRGKMTLRLSNVGNTNVYFDDFRFHPFAANMQSYAYDPASLRLMATLDENNYATFYEYDDAGMLVRVKRETEKGIVTLQEGRNVLKTNNIIE